MREIRAAAQLNNASVVGIWAAGGETEPRANVCLTWNVFALPNRNARHPAQGFGPCCPSRSSVRSFWALPQGFFKTNSGQITSRAKGTRDETITTWLPPPYMSLQHIPPSFVPSEADDVLLEHLIHILHIIKNWWPLTDLSHHSVFNWKKAHKNCNYVLKSLYPCDLRG